MPFSGQTIELHSSEDWRLELKQSFRTAESLLRYLGLSVEQEFLSEASDFPLLVPRPFAKRMHSDWNDPLLRQVLNFKIEEHSPNEHYFEDPLEESSYSPVKGLLHKYQGRALILAHTACAVNCRYCFRRHFPYDSHRIQWHSEIKIFEYIHAQEDIEEVILSGGDPLLLKDRELEIIFSKLEKNPRIKRIRIHTRLPVVIPKRITEKLLKLFEQSSKCIVMVLHINHGNEIDEALKNVCLQLSLVGVSLLNQGVLLKGVNDSVEILGELSERLFESRIMPYYMHLLDPVKGAAHFELSSEEIDALYQGLQRLYSGYLIPKFVKEIPGATSKTSYQLIEND